MVVRAAPTLSSMEQPNLQDALRKLRGGQAAAAPPPGAAKPSPSIPGPRWVAPVSAAAAAILSITLGWFLSGGSEKVSDRLDNQRGKARTVQAETRTSTDSSAPDYEVVDTPGIRIFFPKATGPDWRPGHDLPN